MINKLYLRIIYSLNWFKTGQTSLEIKCSANKVYFSFVKYKFSNIGHFSFYKAFTKREINYLKITYCLNTFKTEHTSLEINDFETKEDRTN